MNRTLKTSGIVIVAAAAAGALVALLVRDQISRHQRNLFSPRAFKRLAALGHIGREPASVRSIRVLRDFIAWERHALLRDRAREIMARMEGQLGNDRAPQVEAEV